MTTDGLPWGAAALGLLLAAGFAAAWRRSLGRERGLAGELERQRGAPRSNEFRVERFGLIWFPAVSYLAAERLVTQAAPGVPYCKACSKPLAPEPAGGWACKGCGERRTDSVADPAAIDSVLREGIGAFLERHPEYRLAPELQRLGAKR